jgi:hypothetical protein
LKEGTTPKLSKSMEDVTPEMSPLATKGPENGNPLETSEEQYLRLI